MSAERAKRDLNRETVVLFVTNDAALDPTMGRVDASTLRLLVNATITGTAAVTGTVAIDQTTPGSTNNVEVTGHGGVPIKDDTAFGDGVTTGILSEAVRVWNGSSYDRLRGTIANGATVDVTRTQGAALGNNQVTVDTTSGGVVIVAAGASRLGAQLTNQGSVDCYVGTGTVTSGNGFLLRAGESLPMPTVSAIKGITASGSTTVGYLSYT